MPGRACVRVCLCGCVFVCACVFVCVGVYVAYTFFRSVVWTGGTLVTEDQFLTRR